MPEYSFTTRSALMGYNKDFAGVLIAEIADISIMSIGIPANGQKALSAALLDGLGLHIPKTGSYATSAHSDLLSMRENQFFLVSGAPVLPSIRARLKANAYLTNQSDSWVMLSVSGENARAVLTRICPLDLHPDKFPRGRVGRSLMAHLGGIIYRRHEDVFCLLTPRSSAGSFLHALEGAAISASAGKP